MYFREDFRIFSFLFTDDYCAMINGLTKHSICKQKYKVLFTNCKNSQAMGTLVAKILNCLNKFQSNYYLFS